MLDLLKAATELLNRLEADKEVIEKGRWKGERDNLAECIIKEREKNENLSNRNESRSI